MARSFRQLIESVVFAGLKPGGPNAQSSRMRWLGPLREPIERLLSGGPAPSDPLYLSNRSPRQRMIFALKIASPFVVLAAIAAFAFRSSLFHKDQPKLDMSPGELAAKIMPDVDKIQLETNKDIEVPSVGVDHSGPAALVGTVRNNTGHTIPTVEILIEVTDVNGSKLGGVTARVQNVAPKSDANFRVPIPQEKAVIALVRDIRTP